MNTEQLPEKEGEMGEHGGTTDGVGRGTVIAHRTFRFNLHHMKHI